MGKTTPAYPLDISGKDAVREILRGVPALIKLIWRIITDKNTALPVKIWLGGAALYLISPFNFKPAKGLPLPFRFLNRADDLILILFAVLKMFEKTPFELLEKHWSHSMPLSMWRDLVFKIYTDMKQFR
ncbi:MAG TPA: hypothetical protein ENN84_07705 [Candidatus Marinimicrobia bacterium]|nr:hypothetical protein [Candidatus Neomarinimicrobiota bacterium]